MRFNLIYKRVKDTDPIEIPSLVRDDEGGTLSGPEAYKAFWKAYNETQRTINALIYQLEMVRDSLNKESSQTNNIC